jgi:hypothetical protein
VEGGGLLLDDAEHVLFAEDEVVLALDLHLGPGVLAEEDGVAGLDVERADLAVLEDLAVADGDDLALERLLLGGVGDDDPPLVLFSSATRLTISRSCSGRIFISVPSCIGWGWLRGLAL